MIRQTIASVSLFALLGCAAPLHAAQTFGDPMPEGEAIALSAALASADSFGPPARKFSGRVVEVCQNRGCWMVLEDDGHSARVTVPDHAYELPKDASGRAVVFGELTVKELDQATAEHLAHDSADGKPVASREYRIAVQSVLLEDA
jgi:hypothetical protein